MEERVLVLSEEGPFMAAQFEHISENLGSLLLAELLSPAPRAQTSDPGARATLSL